MATGASALSSTSPSTALPRKSVIFGASGVVGQAIAHVLSERISANSDPLVTAVSRSGKIPALADLPGVCCKAGNALDEENTLELCQGVDVIYCSIGLPYNSDVWEKGFPVIVKNLLEAATVTGAVLVWVDNLYMFGPEAAESGLPMKESSRTFTEYGGKPAIRSRLDNMMLDAAESGKCKVALVRASDFYGPGVTNSALGETFFPKLINGGRVMLLGDPTKRHAYTYVPDLAVATVAVAEAGESAWGRAWHCPNAPAVPTTTIIEKAGEICGRTKPAKTLILSGFTRTVLSLFIPPLRDMREMAFVWNNDYLVDHSEFSARFPELELPTPLDEGLLATAKWWRAHEQK